MIQISFFVGHLQQIPWRLEQMKEEKRCGKRPEDYLGLIFGFR
jgi:hypothetical protein